VPKDNFYLLCDVCGHKEHYEEEMTRKFIGTPCPACGANMLTEADYKLGRRVRFVLRIFEFLGLMRRGAINETPGPGERKLQIHGHKSKVTLTEIE